MRRAATPALPVRGRERRDPATRSGVNAADGTVWGARVAPVTGRRSRRSPGWTSNVSGGQYVETQGTRYLI